MIRSHLLPGRGFRPVFGLFAALFWLLFSCGTTPSAVEDTPAPAATPSPTPAAQESPDVPESPPLAEESPDPPPHEDAPEPELADGTGEEPLEDLAELSPEEDDLESSEEYIAEEDNPEDLDIAGGDEGEIPAVVLPLESPAGEKSPEVFPEPELPILAEAPPAPVSTPRPTPLPAPPPTPRPTPQPAPMPTPAPPPAAPAIQAEAPRPSPPPFSSGPPPEPPAYLRSAEPVSPPSIRSTPVITLPEIPASRNPAEGKEPVFSRRIGAALGQYVEIPFRGSGWVYLGEMESRRGVAYESRRLDSEGQSFVFRFNAPGTFVLKFYRQDFIRDFILNDYVEIAVEEVPHGGSSSQPMARVIAEPRWPLVPELPARAASSGPVSPPEIPSPETAPVRQAQASPPSTPAPEPRPEPNPVPGRTLQPQVPVQTRPVQAEARPAPVPSPTPWPSLQPAPAARRPDPMPPPPPARTVVRAVPIPTEDFQAGAVPESRGMPRSVESGVLAGTPPAESPQSAALGEGPAAFISQVRQEMESGKPGSALEVLDKFRSQFPGGSDEAWWLYGQLLESPGSQRNIRKALDYYHRLVREYPQSPRVEDARKRISYLERHYINIR